MSFLSGCLLYYRLNHNLSVTMQGDVYDNAFRMVLAMIYYILIFFTESVIVNCTMYTFETKQKFHFIV